MLLTFLYQDRTNPFFYFIFYLCSVVEWRDSGLTTIEIQFCCETWCQIRINHCTWGFLIFVLKIWQLILQISYVYFLHFESICRLRSSHQINKMLLWFFIIGMAFRYVINIKIVREILMLWNFNQKEIELWHYWWLFILQTCGEIINSAFPFYINRIEAVRTR